MGIRLLKVGGLFQVYAHGVPVGRVERDRTLGLWRAIPLSGSGEGVFRSKRLAAEWLAGHTH